jgi:hypothetical protein
MAIARYSFLPWLRRGIANQITAAADAGPRAEMDAVLTVETRKSKNGNEGLLTGTATQKLRLIGPGDIIGINSQMVVRTEPRNWVTDFEPNYLAFIEFYDEDFPWRYSPVPPAGHRLSPWLALMVLCEDEFDRITMPGRPLTSVKLNGANWQTFMPAADKTWAWAHVHINEIINNAALNEHDFSEADHNALENILKNNPDKGISRLISPRHLKPKTRYYAFVIPAFEVGRKAGLGINVADNEAGNASSWTNGQTEFPVYHEWFFSTSEAGDFETLVRRLVPRDMDPRVGIRNMDVQQPGFGVVDVHTQYTDVEKGITHPLDIVGLEGALKAPTTRSIPLSDDSDFEEKLEPVVNLQFELLEEGGAKPADDPVIAPPLYGHWHAIVDRLSLQTADSGWVSDLNRDPRWRATSGMGTLVVRKNQENYMRKAWQQIGDVIEMNRKIQYTQLSMWVSQMMYDKHLRSNVPERVFQITSAVHAKIKGSPFTIRYLTKNSNLPVAVTSGGFRKMTRPRGLYARRMFPSGNPADNIATLIQQLNEGKISAAPPLALPESTPTLGGISDGLNSLANAARPSFFERYGKWLLVLLLLILLLILGLTGSILVKFFCLAVGAAAIWLYLRHKNAHPADPGVPGTEGPLPDPEQAAELGKVAGNFIPERMTPGVVSEIPLRAVFTLSDPGIEPGQVSAALPPGTPASQEAPVAQEFRDALMEFHGELQIVPPPLPKRQPLDFGNAHTKVMTAVNPVLSFPKRVIPQLVAGSFSYKDYIGKYADKWKFQPGDISGMERIVEVMAYPHFKNAMYEPLRDESAELFVPNLNLIPPNTISLMVTNQQFIESYMVGLNHEFSRELLWREYPSDLRGSYFRQFWNVDGYVDKENLSQEKLEEKLRDIPEIHRWGKHTRLGTHNHREQGGDKEQLVLVIRGDILKRYPNTIVYAMRAKWDDDPQHPDNLVIWDETGENPNLNDSNILYPIYKAEVKPDITFLGFDLTIVEAKGHPDLEETARARASIPADQLGWFFVIKEVPGEPRFGLDEDPADNPSEFKWDNMSWQNLGNDVALIDAGAVLNPVPQGTDPHGISWNSHSADLAYILYQKPVLVAVHSREMLKNLNNSQ